MAKKNGKKNKLLSEIIMKKAKKSFKRSRIGWLGGIKGRLAVFLISFLLPSMFTLFFIGVAVVIMSGGMLAIISVDPDLNVKVEKQKEESNNNNSGGRKIVIPEEVKGKLLYPTGTTLTSIRGPRWGRIHNGIDLAGNFGGGKNNIYPIYPGEVTVKKTNASGWGYVIVIKHNVEGTILYSLYGHMQEMYVNEGQMVDFDTVIGTQGARGDSKGVHLHLELHDANFTYYSSTTHALNPYDYLYCGDGLTVSQSNGVDIQKCMNYRFQTTGSGK